MLVLIKLQHFEEYSGTVNTLLFNLLTLQSVKYSRKTTQLPNSEDGEWYWKVTLLPGSRVRNICKLQITNAIKTSKFFTNGHSYPG